MKRGYEMSGYRFRLTSTMLVLGACLFAPQAYGDMTLELVPVQGSGIENTDWELGPGANEITLMTVPQNVLFKVFLTWTGQLQTYQVALSCANLDSCGQDTLTPIAVLCEQIVCSNDEFAQCRNAATDCPAGGTCVPVNGFVWPWCQEVNPTHPGIVFTGSSISACDVQTLLCDGTPGRFRCGATSLTGGTNNGVDRYAASFATRVNANAFGTCSFVLDQAPNVTFFDGGGVPFDPFTFIDATITVPCVADSQCNDGVPCTVDNCNETTGLCENGLTPLAGDYDADSKLGLDDYSHFPDCFTGATAGEVPDCCEVFDFDGDGDRDLADFAAWANGYSAQ